MKIYHQNDLDGYMRNDWILHLLKSYETKEDASVRTHRWLMEMESKRMIYADLYGDLLTSTDKQRRVLDVGGGYHSLTKLLAENNDYTLLDFFSHGTVKEMSRNDALQGMECISSDWYDITDNETYDIVVANDVFPDVDQRLELFVERYHERCREIRLLLTFYNVPKFYSAKRMDDLEILTFLSWDGEITAMKLRKWAGCLDATEAELNLLEKERESVFRNGRQVAYVRIKGKLR